MAKDTTAEKLYALAKDNAKRTKFARFLDLIDAIETALGAGVSRELVRLELAAGDLELSMPTFKTFLQRARARKQQSRYGTTQVAGSTPAPIAAPVAQLAPLPVNTGTQTSSREPDERSHQTSRTVSHNPADLRGLRDADPGLDELSKFSKGRNKK